ncbi:MAG: APC family permease [Candidatus Staskawiczbacteria bacterium]|nr:APC family permease [Candidatus Staskawiczbacteria bacterium]
MENNINLPKRNLPRDVFLHLLVIVTLYWSAISFVTLCWQYVNYFFADALDYGYTYAGFSGPIRFAVSSLIIVFPIFLLVSWFLNKIYSKESQVRESKVRKWLIYLTLFVASLVIIGDLISVINTFLGGEITVRFILKALSILVVALVIFWYYLDDVRREAPSKTAKYFAIVVGLVVAFAVIGSFFIVGSPQTARLLQFDQQKINDLQSIQYQIVNYWQRKGQLPSALSELEDPISGYSIPLDSQKNQPYEYSIKDGSTLTFELCADFNLESSENQIRPKYSYLADGISQNWEHQAGVTCFERVIDKQLYPQLNK